MKIQSEKTKVEVMQDIMYTNFKEGDIGYVDAYVRAADKRPYAVVVRISDGYIDLISIGEGSRIKAIAINDN